MYEDIDNIAVSDTIFNFIMESVICIHQINWAEFYSVAHLIKEINVDGAH